MSNSENLVTNLRSELERCLLSNREKRAQLGKITEDLSAIQNEAKELRERCERAEKTAYEQQVMRYGSRVQYREQDVDMVTWI